MNIILGHSWDVHMNGTMTCFRCGVISPDYAETNVPQCNPLGYLVAETPQPLVNLDPVPKKCTCGSDSLGGGSHSTWCDKESK